MGVPGYVPFAEGQGTQGTWLALAPGTCSALARSQHLPVASVSPSPEGTWWVPLRMGHLGDPLQSRGVQVCDTARVPSGEGVRVWLGVQGRGRCGGVGGIYLSQELSPLVEHPAARILDEPSEELIPCAPPGHHPARSAVPGSEDTPRDTRTPAP